MQHVRIIGASIAAALLFTAALAQAAPAAPSDITIHLPAAAWNIVIQGLAELPLKTSAPVVQAIQEQAKAQLEPSAPAEKPKK